MNLERIRGGIRRGQHLDIEPLKQGARAEFRFRQAIRDLIVRNASIIGGPDLVVVNAASLGSTGLRICQSLREKQEEHLPIVLILDDGKLVDKSAADVVLNLPFTVQKLVNRLRPLLPGDGNNIIHVGPIRLDTEHRRVKCLSKNSRLTPRLVSLLQSLLSHRGEVIGREELFKQVWETNYTGDTRTLDVHISWLRRAIEIDPNHPRFLHTVRGVGYRLDV